IYDDDHVELSVINSSMSADVDLDGDVDGNDFLWIQRTEPSLISLWESQYGSTAPLAAAQAVPEPATLLMALLAAQFLLSRCVASRLARTS
ncbi:MAG: hypothetical protein ACR2NM_07495, partial [Bythopirellula sp.]